VLPMPRVGDGLDEVRVVPRAAAVLRWAGPAAGLAAPVGRTRIPGQGLLYLDAVDRERVTFLQSVSGAVKQ
jgi:hypothetical protein